MAVCLYCFGIIKCKYHASYKNALKKKMLFLHRHSTEAVLLLLLLFQENATGFYVHSSMHFKSKQKDSSSSKCLLCRTSIKEYYAERIAKMIKLHLLDAAKGSVINDPSQIQQYTSLYLPLLFLFRSSCICEWVGRLYGNVSVGISVGKKLIVVLFAGRDRLGFVMSNVWKRQ